MNYNNKISACMVIRNEEGTLGRCLESIKNIVNEIIIIHDGKCNDKSLDIARKYTKKIFVKNFKGEAEIYRPFSFRKAKYNWILQIDADEYLSKKAQKMIPLLIKESDDAYSFSWPIWTGTKNIMYNLKKIFLARKDSLFYLGIPHQSLKSRGTIKHVNCVVYHKPGIDNLNIRNILDKSKRWSKIQSEIISKEFTEISSFNANKNDFYSRKRRLLLSFPLLTGCSLGLINFVKYFFLYEGALYGLDGLLRSFRAFLDPFFLGYYLLIKKIRKLY